MATDMTIKHPICAVCNKMVRQMIRWHDVANRKWVFQAMCHGQVEECSISDIDLSASHHSLLQGVAFLEASATGIEPVRSPHTPVRVPTQQV